MVKSSNPFRETEVLARFKLRICHMRIFNIGQQLTPYYVSTLFSQVLNITFSDQQSHFLPCHVWPDLIHQPTEVEILNFRRRPSDKLNADPSLSTPPEKPISPRFRLNATDTIDTQPLIRVVKEEANDV